MIGHEHFVTRCAASADLPGLRSLRRSPAPLNTAAMVLIQRACGTGKITVNGHAISRAGQSAAAGDRR
jgi:hypothetical protein